MTQRPDLFGAALPAVGVLDMLRFQMFTIGWAWTSDYGSSDDPDDFGALLAYSPYTACARATLPGHAGHHRRPRRPGLPRAFVQVRRRAAARAGGDVPVLLRVETKAGHGAGKPTAKVIDETADRYAFLVKTLGMPGSPSLRRSLHPASRRCVDKERGLTRLSRRRPGPIAQLVRAHA